MKEFSWSRNGAFLVQKIGRDAHPKTSVRHIKESAEEDRILGHLMKDVDETPAVGYIQRLLRFAEI